jgi:hypothetical protein
VHYFLNMQAKSLGSLGNKIGGLLGEDDHVSVSTPPPGCKFEQLTAVHGNQMVSFASARMTLIATQTDLCPVGYNQTTKNLGGTSVDKSSATDVPSCASACDNRAGCTSFEVGPSTKYAGCYTYTGGAGNVQQSPQMADWVSCRRSEPAPVPNVTVSRQEFANELCPEGYTHSSMELKGPSADRTSSVTDILTCAATCDSRAGCTSFEVGATTPYAGCFTYTGGTANVVKTQVQKDAWNTCLRNEPAPRPTAAPGTSGPQAPPVAGVASGAPAPASASCSEADTDRYPDIGGCCPGITECTEKRISGDPQYCAPNDPGFGSTCWNTMHM